MADRTRARQRAKKSLNRRDVPLTMGARIVLGLVRFYQRFLSPALPPTCRFQPTCSEYTAQAILQYGAVKGAWLGMRRIGRCHPFSKGGYDPVP